MYVRDAGNSKRGTLKRPKIYNTWLRMRHRCCCETGKDYKYYGGRGITICKEWQDDYDAFRSWAITSGVRKELSLDRIDNDGPYSPENCRWVTQAEQNRNRGAHRPRRRRRREPNEQLPRSSAQL